MAGSPKTQVLKLAIGLASVVAVAGLAGQLSQVTQAQDVPPGTGGALADADRTPQPGRSQPQSGQDLFGSQAQQPDTDSFESQAQQQFQAGGGNGFFVQPQPNRQGGSTRTHRYR